MTDDGDAAAACADNDDASIQQQLDDAGVWDFYWYGRGYYAAPFCAILCDLPAIGIRDDLRLLMVVNGTHELGRGAEGWIVGVDDVVVFDAG